MKKLAARLNLILILILIIGGYYVSSKNIAPFSDFISKGFSYISSTIGNNAYATVYYAGLLILLFTVFVSLYAAFEGNESKLEKEIKKLKEENEKQEIDNVGLLEENNKYSNETEELKAQLNNAVAKEAHEELTAKFEELEKKLEEISNNLETAEAEKEAQSTELATTISENKKTKQQLSASKKNLEAAKEENKNLKTEKSELAKELETTKEELSQANANLKGGRDAVPPAAYQIFYLLQKEGRFIDMLHEEIEEYDDETLGSAFRKLHEDLQALFEERFVLEPVLNEEEGSEITLKTIDTEQIKVSGKVPSEGPYTGELIHKGWRLKECRLPEMVEGWSGDVVAQAEIEI